MASQCPLCLRGYQRLSQHLRVLHKVANLKERRLLLALSSRRVNVHTFLCPVAGCGKGSSRLDRHLRKHTELTNAARKKAMATAKKRKVLSELAELRASKPSVPMVSDLDLESSLDAEHASHPPAEEELTNEARKEAMATAKKQKVLAELADLRASEPSVPMVSDLDLQSSADLDALVLLAEDSEKPCENACCKALQKQVEDLKKQVDILSTTLTHVTRCYRKLQWWMTLGPGHKGHHAAA